MKRTIILTIGIFALAAIYAQNPTKLFLYKSGSIIKDFIINEIDSISFSGCVGDTVKLQVYLSNKNVFKYKLTEVDSISFVLCDQYNSARQKVLDDYKNIYLPTQDYDMGWTGNVSTCTPGTISQTVQDNTLKCINYFRTLVGLPGNITFDPLKDAKCQQTALMCNANNAINHYPPSDWLCYTADGAEAASKSNLAWGAAGGEAVNLYMDDFGASNTLAAHRRWILYPRMKAMGHGATSAFDCLWVIGDNYSSYPSNMPQYVCWPPRDFVPAPLVFGRWTFSIPGASYGSTKITMTDENNNNIPLNIVSYNATGYGENTIVWEPTGINTSSLTGDVTYYVKVQDVQLGNLLNTYEYKVIIVQPGTKKKNLKTNNHEVL